MIRLLGLEGCGSPVEEIMAPDCFSENCRMILATKESGTRPLGILWLLELDLLMSKQVRPSSRRTVVAWGQQARVGAWEIPI